MRVSVLLLLRCYRMLVSPFLPPACRFHPTCSEYAEDAVRIHGVTRGTWLAVSRLLRCHPWADAGVDPVPTL